MRASSPKLPPSLMLVTHSPFTYTCRGQGTVSGVRGQCRGPGVRGQCRGPGVRGQCQGPGVTHPLPTHSCRARGLGAGVTLSLAAWGALHSTPGGAGGPCTPTWDSAVLCPAQDQPRCPPHAQPRPDRGWTGTKMEVLSALPPARPPADAPLRTPTSQARLHSTPHPETPAGATLSGCSRPTQVTPPTQLPRSQAALPSVPGSK